MFPVNNLLSKLIRSEKDPFNSPWGFKDVILLLIFFMVFNLVPLIFLGVLNEPLYVQYFFSILFIALIMFFAKHRYTNYQILGFKKDNLLKAIINGLLFGFVGFLIIISISSTLYTLIELSPNIDIPTAVYGMFALMKHKLGFLMFFIAPVGEELLMRGVIYSALRKKINILLSALICSLIFAVIHIPLFDADILAKIFDILTISIIMSFIYEKYKSIFAPITAHAIYNYLIAYTEFLMRLGSQ